MKADYVFGVAALSISCARGALTQPRRIMASLSGDHAVELRGLLRRFVLSRHYW
jgi:hypothetical protein